MTVTTCQLDMVLPSFPHIVCARFDFSAVVFIKHKGRLVINK